MRVALAALRSDPGREDENLRQLSAAVASVAGQVDLIVTGEAFGQGFEAITDDPAHDLAIGWTLDGPQIASVRELARQHSTAICLGFNERSGSALHSSALPIGADGEPLAVHRRMSTGWRAPDADPGIDGEGDEPAVFHLAGKRCTIALCGDLWVMPERFAATGAEVVLWPIFVNFSPQVWRDEHLQDYAHQASTVAPDVVLVNSLAGHSPASPDWVTPSYGGAARFSEGKVMRQLEMGAPGLLVVDVP